MELIDGEAEDRTCHGSQAVDAEKVAALRAAVEANTLPTDAQLIAVRLLGWERLLTRS